MSSLTGNRKIYVVEHLDPELEQWSALEYITIATESATTGADFVLSSVSSALRVPAAVQNARGIRIEQRSVEELFAQCKDRVCLLDPAAQEELTPRDAVSFDVFLFGGILGDDPPRDRTSELRRKGYQGRRLGPVQMTTDTAVRTTRMVIHHQMSLSEIPYVDNPELKISHHESTQMPFRYVVGKDGTPIMPKGMIELIKQDSEKGFGELL